MNTTLDDPLRTLLPTDPPSFGSPSLPEATAGLVDVELLGEGGTGRVALARQDLLDRHVAVKRLKHASTVVASQRLLHEARMMGCLEHPNVPPVHAFGVDHEGVPLLVMKRIDGNGWAPGSDLERDVGVLVATLDALVHAHEIGVVHRDLKPANVMLGQHDEVYLMDWGAAWPSDTPGGIAGTPAFMAPEMFVPGVVRPSMDVFIAGAALHLVLTGVPLHDGPTFEACRLQSTQARPRLEGVDAELAGWVQRTTRLHPEERPSMRTLRDGLAEWLATRPAARLADAAEARIARFEQTRHLDAAELTEALFALRQACSLRPSYAPWRERLDHLLELAIRDAVRRDARLELARGWLDELEQDHPHPLRAELEEARRRVRRRDALAWENDDQVVYTDRFRSFGLWMGGFGLCVAIGEASGWIRHADPLGNAVYGVLFLTTLLITAGLRREIVLANRANRAYLAGFLLMAGAVVFNRSLGWWREIPHTWVLAVDALLLGSVTLTLGFTYGRVNQVLGVGLLAGAVAVLIAPPQWAAVVFLAPAFATLVAFVVATRGGFRRQAPVRRPSRATPAALQERGEARTPTG